MKWQYMVLLIYPAILNIAGFCSMAIDKNRAKKKQWRIKERTLFLIAILGGSLGSVLGMYTYRHKTKHKAFVIGMPFLLFLQFTGIIYMLFFADFT